jgi:hypothetical protein
MFTHKHGATATYRTLARGSGSRWVRAYQASQQKQARIPSAAPSAVRIARARARVDAHGGVASDGVGAWTGGSPAV